MAKNKVRCGLDFGTSNSVITLTDSFSKKQIFSFSDSSILYFPNTNDMLYSVGKSAQQQYVDEEMSGRLLKSVKTLLPEEKFKQIWICGKKFTPEQLVSIIIKHLKDKAEIFLKEELTEVTLGRPAVFSKNPKKEELAVKRLLEAARMAGFSDVKLELEPIAAAFSYEQSLSKPENVLVADFGGGTSDFTIMNLAPEKIAKNCRKKDILAHGGLTIGGDLFDSEIMWHKVTPHLGRGVKYKSYNKEIEIPKTLHWELRSWERSFMLKESKLRRSMDKYYVFSNKNQKIDNLRVLIDKNYAFSLFKRIEQAKIELSEQDKSLIDFHKESIKIQQDFDLSNFFRIIESHIKEIKEYLNKLLASLNFTNKDVDSVFITGGTSLAKPIQQLISDMFGKEKLRTNNIFSSVAYGLSIY